MEPCLRISWGLIPRAVLGGTVLIGVWLPSQGEPGVTLPGSLVPEAVLDLEARCLLLGPGTSQSLASGLGEVRHGAPGRVVLDLPWPDASRPSRLELTAALASPIQDGPFPLALEARLVLGDGRSLSRSRAVELSEGGSSLLEIWSREPERLVVVLSVEKGRRPALRPRPRSLQSVRIHLVIEAMLGDRAVPLETNDLGTFLGEPIEYGFRRGAGDTLESVELRLTPVKIEGDTAELEAEVTGRLPSQDAPLVLGLRQRLVASRGATSVLTVTAGDPAKGYRFRVTPDW